MERNAHVCKKLKKTATSPSEIILPEELIQDCELNRPVLRSCYQSPSAAKNIEEFQLNEVIGKGMFGFVYLASHKTSGNKCAIKLMPKKSVIAVGEENRVIEEKNCLVALKGSPFIAQLYSSFQDVHNVLVSSAVELHRERTI